MTGRLSLGRLQDLTLPFFAYSRVPLNASMLILRHPYALGGHATGFNPTTHYDHRNLLLEAFRASGRRFAGGCYRYLAVLTA